MPSSERGSDAQSVIDNPLQDEYGDCTSIDWGREYAKERKRKSHVKLQRGFDGAVGTIWDNAVTWIVITVSRVDVKSALL